MVSISAFIIILQNKFQTKIKLINFISCNCELKNKKFEFKKIKLIKIKFGNQ